MPILHTDELEHILDNYNYRVRKFFKPFFQYGDVDNEKIKKSLNTSGYYVHKEYLIIDTQSERDFKYVVYKGDGKYIRFEELLDIIKINIRNANIDKLID